MNAVPSKPSFQLIEGEGKDINNGNEDDYTLDESENLLYRVDNLESEVTTLNHELASLRTIIESLKDK